MFLLDQLRHAAGQLRHGQKQWLEIGMLLMQEPELLLLDEPVAGMSAAEREQTGELLQRSRRATLGGGDRARHGLRARASRTRVTVLHAGQVAQRGHGRTRCRPTRA